MTQSPYRRRRIRRLAIATVATAVPLIIICGTIVVFYHQDNNKSVEQRTANGAIIEFHDAIQYKDTDRLQKSLCASQRASAKKYISNFYSRLDSFVAMDRLQTISWLPGSAIETTKNEKIIDGQAEVTGRRQTETPSNSDLPSTEADVTATVDLNYRITVKLSSSKWYVCGADTI